MSNAKVPCPCRKLCAICGKAESKGVEVGVVGGHVAPLVLYRRPEFAPCYNYYVPY